MWAAEDNGKRSASQRNIAQPTLRRRCETGRICPCRNLQPRTRGDLVTPLRSCSSSAILRTSSPLSRPPSPKPNPRSQARRRAPHNTTATTHSGSRVTARVLPNSPLWDQGGALRAPGPPAAPLPAARPLPLRPMGPGHRRLRASPGPMLVVQLTSCPLPVPGIVYVVSPASKGLPRRCCARVFGRLVGVAAMRWQVTAEEPHAHDLIEI